MPTRLCRRALKLRPATLSVLGLIAYLFATWDALAFRLYTVGGDAACSFSDLQQAMFVATFGHGRCGHPMHGPARSTRSARLRGAQRQSHGPARRAAFDRTNAQSNPFAKITSKVAPAS